MSKITQSLRKAETEISRAVISLFVLQSVSLTQKDGRDIIYLNPRGDYTILSVLGIDISSYDGLKINGITVEIMNNNGDTRDITLLPHEIKQFDRD